MNRAATGPHGFKKQDVRSGSRTREADSGIHGRELLFQQFFNFCFLARRKSGSAPVGCVKHVPGKNDQLGDWEAIVERTCSTVKLPR